MWYRRFRCREAGGNPPSDAVECDPVVREEELVGTVEMCVATDEV